MFTDQLAATDKSRKIIIPAYIKFAQHRLLRALLTSRAIPTVSTTEVEKTIKRMKSGKAIGLNVRYNLALLLSVGSAELESDNELFDRVIEEVRTYLSGKFARKHDSSNMEKRKIQKNVQIIIRFGCYPIP